MGPFSTVVNSIIFFLFVFISRHVCSQDIPISQEEYALQVGNRESGIRVELFVDIACSDSKAAWTTLLETANYYKDSAVFLIHLFPLPYHTFSFLATQAIVYTWENYGVEYALEAMNILFAKQDKILVNDENKAKSYTYFEDVIAKLVSGKVPDMSLEDALAGMNDDAIDQLTRAMWKYGAERGVYGAPNFFVNGIHLDTIDSESSFYDWQAILDPVVSQTSSVISSKALPKTVTDTVLSDALRVEVEEEQNGVGIHPIFEENMMYESNLVIGFCGFLFLFGVLYIAMVAVKYTRMRPRGDRNGPVILPPTTQNSPQNSDIEEEAAYEVDTTNLSLAYGTDESASGLM